jgi:hypothetical protein
LADSLRKKAKDIGFGGVKTRLLIVVDDQVSREVKLQIMTRMGLPIYGEMATFVRET